MRIFSPVHAPGLDDFLQTVTHGISSYLQTVRISRALIALLRVQHSA